jgi:hypothetical protein
MEDESFEKLKELAKSQGDSIGDYCEFMIDYIDKNGINPKHSLNTLMQNNNASLAKMEKRLSQVIAFQRQHEDKALYRIADDSKEIKSAVLQLIDLHTYKTS